MRSNRRDDFQVGTGHSRYAGLQLVEGALSLSAHLLARDPTLLAGQLVGRGHSEDVMAVAVTPDGKRAVSASDDNTLKLWDLERFRSCRLQLCGP